MSDKKKWFLETAILMAAIGSMWLWRGVGRAIGTDSGEIVSVLSALVTIVFLAFLAGYVWDQ